MGNEGNTAASQAATRQAARRVRIAKALDANSAALAALRAAFFEGVTTPAGIAAVRSAYSVLAGLEAAPTPITGQAKSMPPPKIGPVAPEPPAATAPVVAESASLPPLAAMIVPKPALPAAHADSRSIQEEDDRFEAAIDAAEYPDFPASQSRHSLKGLFGDEDDEPFA